MPVEPQKKDVFLRRAKVPGVFIFCYDSGMKTVLF
jgi:hypothetical protein